jgi:PAS domain S-box-containing protein
MAATTRRDLLPYLDSASPAAAASDADCLRLTRLACRLLQAQGAVLLPSHEPGGALSRVATFLENGSSLDEVGLIKVVRSLVIPARGSLVFRDTQADAPISQHAALQELRIRALLGIALEMPSGDRVGTLFLVDAKTRDWTNDLAESVQELAQGLLREGLLCRAATQDRSWAELCLARERRFRSLIEHSTDLLMLLSPDGVILYHSPSCQRWLGYGLGDLSDVIAYRLIHPEDRARVRSAFLQQRAQIKARPITLPLFRCRAQDGTWHWLESTATILLDDPDVQGIVINARDVSEQVGVEAALRESETRYRRIVETATEGVWITDPQGRTTFVNQQLARMLGYAPEEMLGHQLEEYLPKEEHGPLRERLEQRKHGIAERYEARCLHRDGSERWLSVSATPISDEHGAHQGSLALLRDLTEQATKQREAEERRQVFLKLGQQLNAAQTPRDAARTILAAADQLLGWDACWLELIVPEAGTGTFVFAMDLLQGVRTELPPTPRVAPLGPLTRQLIEAGPVLMLRTPEELTAANVSETYLYGDESRRSASLLCVPILQEDRIVGAMSVQSYQFEAYNATDLETLQALADYCAVALQRTQAEAARLALQQQVVQAQQAEAEALREQARLATLREEIGSALAAPLDLATALREALQPLVRQLPIAFARVWTLDPTSQMLRMQASAGLYSEVSGPRQLLRVGETEIGRLISEGQPQLNNSVQHDPTHAEWANEAGIVGYAGFPMLADGEPLGAVAVFSHEPITPPVYEALGVVAERFARFVDRTRAQQALREMEARFSAFMEHLPAMATIRDEEGRYVYVNRQFEVTYGLRLEEVRGVPLKDLFPPETAAEFEANTQEVLRLDRPQEFIETVTTPDGHLRELLAIKFPIRDPQGRRYIGVICTDLTDRRVLEAQLRQAQKMEAIGRLAGGIAHDFNNVLAVIIGYAELLLSRADLPCAYKAPLADVLQAGKRAASLTRQLLAFSRQEMIQPEVFDLDELVRNFQTMLQRLIGEDIELVLGALPERALVRADRGQIEQILMNLAVNARDAMPQGGTLMLELQNVQLPGGLTRDGEAIAEGAYVCLTVRDTGCGVDPQVLPHIFEPFYTTKGIGEGTGLGLATVYGIVRQHRGHLEAASEAGKGTTFRIYLPRQAQSPSYVSKEPEPETPVGRETILVVEDEAMVRKLVCAVLRKGGYHVLEASTADDALRRCQEYAGEIDLLLTDVVMPGRSGRQLAVFAGARYPRIRVIYMSGYTDDAVVRYGVSAAQVHFLQKPFAPAVLARKVREVLDH